MIYYYRKHICTNLFHMEAFFDKYGYDANIVAIYDDVVGMIVNELDARVEAPRESLQEIIRKRHDLKIYIHRRGASPFELYIPTGSKYYPSDIKGHFVVRGQSYVFVSMDQAVYSYPIIKKSANLVYSVYSYTHKGISRYLKLEMNDSNFFNLSFRSRNLSLYKFMQQLCYVYHKEGSQIFQYYKNSCAKCASYYRDNQLIIDYTDMIDSKVDNVEQDTYWECIKEYFTYEEVINAIAYMSVKLVRYSIDDAVDDIDDESFKVVQTSGATLLNMYYRCFKNGKWSSTELSKLKDKMQNMFLTSSVPNFVGSLKKGVTQELESETVLSSLSHIRRIKVYMSEEQAPYRVREYNRNHKGYTCMFETSDSKAAGLNKYLAVSCLITRETKCFSYDSTNFSERGMATFFNGRMIGYTRNAEQYALSLFDSKDGEATWSVYVKSNTLCMHTNSVRLIRPFSYQGRIIFADIGEYIRHHQKLDEIYRESMLGISASLTTFPHMSPGPRNNYQCSMNKQAISWCPLKFKSTHHEEKILVSSEMPYVLTDGAKDYLARFLDFRHTNVVVAVMADIYNNEDAIILNEGAVKRGLFANIKIINERIYLKTLSSNSEESDQVKTKTASGSKMFVRTKFDSKASSIIYDMGQYIKKEGMELVYDEVGSIKPWNILTKKTIYQTEIDQTQINRLKEYEYKQLHESITFDSKTNMSFTDCHMDETYTEISSFRFRLAEIGDKFATDISQKGVCALLRKESDMIQLPDGTIPHIIINPHGFPSRMTVGTLFNMAIGKYMCTQDAYDHVLVKHLHKPIPYTLQRPINASVFQTMDDLIELIKKHDSGSKVFNPQIGLWTEKPIHYGVLPYFALKHQIDEKAAARLTGPVNLLTGQPISGRKSGGGPALGEMEVNALIAYNALGILKERMSENTDKVDVTYCPKCSFIDSIGYSCPRCGDSHKMIQTRISFIAFKNLLMCMGISVKTM